MSKISWDNSGEHIYETGVNHGVLYPLNASGQYTPGVAWNGLSTVTESPSGAEANPIYADNIKYLNLYSAEEFGATIEAYTYPDEFALCDGTAELVAGTGVQVGQQSRKTFGLCYRTIIGNDEKGDAYGYKLHLLYGCKASPSERSYQTVNDSPEAIAFSWEITTTPINVGDGFNPTSIITIDSTKFTTESQKAKLKAIEDLLYGTDAEGSTQATDPKLPLPSEIMAILNAQG